MATFNRPNVPKEFAGRWIAWDSAMRRIIASGSTAREVKLAAEKAGERNPILDKTPAANVRLIGSRLR